ncbi:MAG TPA: DUF1707 domain-containing protein [Jatrophihabitans sp.]|nr:DUF1707 domain-containing protein [Jatrophihabitans sp.]
MTGWQIGPYQSGRDVRIGTEEREQAVQLLSQHLSAGRLELAEFEERVTAAYGARTAGQLAALFADLPGPLPVLPGYRMDWGGGYRPDRSGYRVDRSGYRTARRGWVPRRAILVLLLIFLLAMLIADVAFPPLFLIPLAWMLIHGRRRFAYAMGCRRR